MAKRMLLLAIVFLASSLVTHALANPPGPGEKFRHADKNKDGVLDKKEIIMEKKWEQKQKARLNTWWERRADTNNDGKVDGDELAAWKKLTKERIDLNNDGVIDAKERRLSWRHAKSRVNTALEAKYDANSDGWLEPLEVKELLKDKSTLIKTKGKAKVDTELEEEYDTNGDGVIDAQEAKTLKEDIEQD